MTVHALDFKAVQSSARLSLGYTLIELMVIVAILAVLLAFTIPSFTNSNLNAEQRGAIQRLLVTFQEAQSIADRDRSTISLCPSANGTTCTNGANWTIGWLMFVGTDSTPPSADSIVGQTDAQSDRLSITLVGATPPLRITYRGNPSLSLQESSFSICDRRGAASASALILGRGGLASEATLRDGNNRLILHDNSVLSCPQLGA